MIMQPNLHNIDGLNLMEIEVYANLFQQSGATVFILNLDHILLKKLFPTMNISKVRIFNIENRKCANVRKRTLEMSSLAWKFNSKKLLCKTLNSRMNIIETRAVLNIVKTDGKWTPEAKREGQELI